MYSRNHDNSNGNNGNDGRDPHTPGVLNYKRISQAMQPVLQCLSRSSWNILESLGVLREVNSNYNLLAHEVERELYNSIISKTIDSITHFSDRVLKKNFVEHALNTYKTFPHSNLLERRKRLSDLSVKPDPAMVEGHFMRDPLYLIYGLSCALILKGRCSFTRDTTPVAVHVFETPQLQQFLNEDRDSSAALSVSYSNLSASFLQDVGSRIQTHSTKNRISEFLDDEININSDSTLARGIRDRCMDLFKHPRITSLLTKMIHRRGSNGEPITLSMRAGFASGDRRLSPIIEALSYCDAKLIPFSIKPPSSPHSFVAGGFLVVSIKNDPLYSDDFDPSLSNTDSITRRAKKDGLISAVSSALNTTAAAIEAYRKKGTSGLTELVNDNLPYQCTQYRDLMRNRSFPGLFDSSKA